MFQYLFRKVDQIMVLNEVGGQNNINNHNAIFNLASSLSWGSNPHVVVNNLPKHQYIDDNKDKTLQAAISFATQRCLSTKPKIIKYVYQQLNPYWKRKLQEYLIRL